MEMCEICRHDPCVSTCPNFNPDVDLKKFESGHYCKICGDRIYRGDYYYENYKHEMIHMECASNWGCGKLLNWFGESASVMEDKNE